MAAIPEAAPQDDPEPSPARPFAAPDAGADYFVTEPHYSSLANRVIARLRSGPGFVLVTGEPPPDPRSLALALMNATGGSYAVGVVACGPELNREQLLRAAPRSGTPLFVFDGVDRLSEVQLGGLCESLASGDGIKPAAVLLACPTCLIRLEQLQPRLLREGVASHFRLYELGLDEVETFIRRQLPPGEQPAALTAEAITAIADFSGGDPATVNRLSRLITEFAESAGSKAAKRQVEGAVRAATPQSEFATNISHGIVDTAMPGTGDATPGEPLPFDAVADRLMHPTEERRTTQRRLLAIIFCLSIVCLSIVEFATVPGNLVSSLGHHAVERIVVFLAALAASSAPPAAKGEFQKTEDVSARVPVGEETGANAPTKETASEMVSAPLSKPTATTPSGEIGEQQPAALLPTAQLPPTSAAARAAVVLPPGRTVPESEPERPPAPAPTDLPSKAPEQRAAPRAIRQIPASPSEATVGAPVVDTATLVARGDALVSARDFVSARLFYERAAEMGDGRGALRMGLTFDPAFLERAGIRGAQGDQLKALLWYRRARDLGDAEADGLLKNLKPH